MSTFLHRIWLDFLGPMLQRPKPLQVAALCHKGEGLDRRYLLITSLKTKRWIIPKGWPIRGLKSNETALREAWEEAGVKQGSVSAVPVGKYIYQKRKPSGLSFSVETLVYSIGVQNLSDSFPEADERTRKWVSAENAARMVDEPDLRQIFLSHS